MRFSLAHRLLQFVAYQLSKLPVLGDAPPDSLALAWALVACRSRSGVRRTLPGSGPGWRRDPGCLLDRSDDEYRRKPVDGPGILSRPPRKRRIRDKVDQRFRSRRDRIPGPSTGFRRYSSSERSRRHPGSRRQPGPLPGRVRLTPDRDLQATSAHASANESGGASPRTGSLLSWYATSCSNRCANEKLMSLHVLKNVRQSRRRRRDRQERIEN